MLTGPRIIALSLLASCGSSTLTTKATAEGTSARGVTASMADVAYEYDAVGNLTRVDLNGAATTTGYDALNRSIESTDALGGVITLSWNAADAPESLLDARGVRTTAQLDGLGGVARLSSADTGETISTLDEAGNVISSTDARGVTTIFSYDALNRITQATSGDAVSYTWHYDDADGGTGLLAGSTFPSGNSRLDFDAEGQLRSITQQVAEVITTTRFGFDAQGRLTQLTYPSGRTLETIWSANGPTALRVIDGAVLRPVLSELELDVEEQPARWTWQLSTGALAHVVRRDLAGRITGYPIGSVWRELEYDGASRITRYAHVDASGASVPALDEQFSYDAANRLVGSSRRGVTTAISYDAMGNRITSGPRAWLTEPASNRLVSTSVDAGVSQAIAFDATGNLVADGALTATYDRSGRLTSVTCGLNTVRSFYDAAGRRVRKVSGTSDLTFVYDPRGQLLGEYDATGAAVREYLWLGQTLVGFFSGPQLFFVQVDHLGAPRVAFDDRGRERWRWLADPFGAEAPEPSLSALEPVELPLRFPGQYADVETGLFFNHFRDYDPVAGRYLQSDPSGLRGGLNTYVYAQNNPVSSVDPDGLTPTDNFYGHNDRGFQQWWHRNKHKEAWFSTADEGFDRKKPNDIPNRKAADALRERYEELKRNGTLNNDEDDGCRRRRRDGASSRRGNRRGGRGWE